MIGYYIDKMKRCQLEEIVRRGIENGESSEKVVYDMIKEGRMSIGQFEYYLNEHIRNEERDRYSRI